MLISKKIFEMKRVIKTGNRYTNNTQKMFDSAPNRY